jgi:hypothetical protein
MWLITPNKANLSIIGAYNYDNTLFDNLQLPDGVNRETVVSNILDYCAELELLYPDLPYLKNAIGYWSAKELPFWEKVREMETADYNPIENYDRYDTEVENTDRAHDRNANAVSNVKNTVTDNNSASTTTEREKDSNTNNVVSGVTKTSGKDINVENGYNRDLVAGYNSEALTTNGGSNSNSTSNANTESETKGETAQMNTEKGSESETISQSGNNTRDDSTQSVNANNETGKEKENRVKSLHSHGNIGVTTVAQMMKEMIDVLPEVNTVSIICESFKRRFCLLVY